MKKITIFFLTAILILVVSVQAFAETDQKFNYDLNANSEEWSHLDHQQKIDGTNISAEVLNDMSTAELLDVVLDYPLLFDMFAFNSMEEGIDVVRENFSGMDELLERADLGDQITTKYLAVNNDLINSKKKAVDQGLAFEKLVLDALLSTSLVAEKLSDSQIKALSESVIEVFDKTNKRPAFWKGDSVIAQDMEAQSTVAYVLTPKGSLVYATIRGEELDQDAKKTLHEEAIRVYPNITKVRDATTNYNCHSYALYSTSSSNKYWIPYPSYFLTDGSYTHVGQYPTGTNQRLYYPLSQYEHTAIINSYGSGTYINSSVKCTSKWGYAGLYKHSATDCPYYVGGAVYKVYK